MNALAMLDIEHSINQLDLTEQLLLIERFAHRLREHMTQIRRGEIYFVDLNPVEGREQSGYRPVLVLSTVSRRQSVSWSSGWLSVNTST
jgi:hypothetical protein